MKTKILASLYLVASSAMAQSFEVAALHANTTGEVPLIRALPGGILSATDESVQTLIRVAYRIGVPQISGPGWMSTARFDIRAKGSPEDVSLAVMAPKIKALLAERFGLVVHEEPSMKSVLVLTMGFTNGGHIMPSAGGDRVLHMARSAMSGQNIAMGDFCRGLSDATGQLYVDETGFTGRFDVDIRWSPMPDDAASLPNSAASLNTVLRETFGLEVKSRKVSVVRLVVDRVNRNPTEN